MPGEVHNFLYERSKQLTHKNSPTNYTKHFKSTVLGTGNLPLSAVRIAMPIKIEVLIANIHAIKKLCI